MPSNYDWLKKPQAKQPKKNNAMTAMPAGMRISTGYGSDGILQPGKPTNMFQTNQGRRLVHEGEELMKNPDGSMRVFSQPELQQFQNSGMPGYQNGGTFLPKDPRRQGQGGGGVGSPLERDVEAVKLDVMNEMVSVQAAREDYGVIFKEDKWPYTVDHEATDKLRRKLKEGG